MVKVRWPPVELVPQRIIPWPSRNCIGANVGHSSPVREIINTLGPGVAAEDCKPMRHALFEGRLQRMVRRIDILGVLGGTVICRAKHIGASDGVEPRRADARS